MLISHEVPISLLERSKEWNDYEYCLPSFYFKYPEYKQYFLNAKKAGRFIIADNGLFEGDEFTNTQLIEFVQELQPDIFITPDKWNNQDKTYYHATNWINTVKPFCFPNHTELMVVLQGETMIDFADLYRDCEEQGYKHFAFNHSSIAYQNISNSTNTIINQMNGRILAVNLLSKGLIKPNHYIHLLGVSLPQEILYYQHNEGKYPFIKSVDTSSPIINGILGNKYDVNGVRGLTQKPKNKLEEFIDHKFGDSIIEIIDYNVKSFKKLCNG